MTILCEPDQQVATALAPALVGAPLRLVANLPEALVAVDEDPDEDLVVIGDRVPLEHVVDFAQHAQQERRAITMLLLRKGYDPETISVAMSAGVSEVLPAGNPAALADAYRRARLRLPVSTPGTSLMEGPAVDPTQEPPTSALREHAPLGRVLTVFSPKGGTGKTTISTNLATALHALTGKRICLVDLDLEFGDVAISLRLTPTKTLVDAVGNDADGTSPDLVEQLATHYEGGFDCVLAPIEPGDAEKIPAKLIEDLLMVLKQRYDYIVVDNPSQLSEKVLTAMDAADHFVLLANPEMPSLKNLRLTLDMLDLLGYPREARSIVFNRADDASGLTRTDVQDALMATVAAEVPASRDVPASINRGVPIVAFKPDHPVSKAILRLARVLTGEPPATKARRGLRVRLSGGRSA